MKTVIEMAREVLDRMAPDDHCREPYWTATNEELERFAELIRADECEACAKVCEDYDDKYDVHTRQTTEGIALEIRARSNT